MSLIPIAPLLFRCYFVVDDPADSSALNPARFVPWPVIEEREAKGIDRGRWDPLHNRIRCLHFANDEVTSFVEVLQDMRPKSAIIEELAAIDDPDDGDPIIDYNERKRRIALTAAQERLESRYMAAVPTSPADRVFDVMLARTEIEVRFGFRPGSLKLGAFTGSDRRLPRKVSDHVVDTSDAVGIYCQSSEADGFVTALFEDGVETSRLRASLGRPAWTFRAGLRTDALTAALRRLALIDEPTPSGGTSSVMPTTPAPPA